MDLKQETSAFLPPRFKLGLEAPMPSQAWSAEEIMQERRQKHALMKISLASVFKMSHEP
jgi:hypothetical protein